MSEFSARDLSMTAQARLGADGKRILCGAIRQRALDGTLRFCCGGEVGRMSTMSAEWGPDLGASLEERIRNGLDKPLIVLARATAPQMNCGAWRRTNRPLSRCVPRAWIIVEGRRRKFDKSETYWGGEGQKFRDFTLPVEVVCPRCKRVNLITDALLLR